jgi:hypothetical protein
MSQGLHALRVNSHTNRPNLNQSELVRKYKFPRQRPLREDTFYAASFA